MTRPGWYSQPFRADGGISAEGLRNQLGRPTMSVLSVLVRESAQNSWDARVDDLVEFRLDLGIVNPSKMAAWRDLLGEGAPRGEVANFPLRRTLKRPAITYLAVSDRGTAGLGGPTEADKATAPGENRNWLSFVLNSGDRQDAQAGGGTYGYGKGAFFLASKVGTILIHTRFRDDAGELQTRLIGSTLMSSYTHRGIPFTGRHWWGRPEGQHCQPLVDDDAEAVASALGLPGFRAGRTGTTVVVVEPDLLDPRLPDDQAEELDIADAAQLLAEAAAWNLWPIMLRDRRQRMDIRVTANGLAVKVPTEDDDATLRAFAEAYRRARHDEAEQSMCLRPKQLLGTFGYENTFGATAGSFAAKELGLDGAPHHFAQMRRPDLVTSYFEGPAKEHPDAGYAGVFKVADELDAVFAEAEPPTHDAWVDSQLKGHDATYVRVARRRLREKTAEIAGAMISRVRSQDFAVGSLSQRLGYLMSGPGASGPVLGAPFRSNGGAAGVAPEDVQTDAQSGPRGAEGSSGGTGDGTDGTADELVTGARQGPSSPRARNPVLIGDPTYEIVMDRYVVRQRVAVGPGTYRGACRVVTGDGGHESEHPVGGSMPTVFAWRNGNAVRRGDTLAMADAGEVDLLIEPVADVVFDIGVEVVQ